MVELLGGWGDLARNFARAELLLAAAEDLLGRDRSAAGAWPSWPRSGRPNPSIFISGLPPPEAGDYQEAADVLGRWPAGSADPDHRPLYLEAILALDQGRVPDLPDMNDPAEEQTGRRLP